jgi:hypothetical protein
MIYGPSSSGSSAHAAMASSGGAERSIAALGVRKKNQQKS